MFCDFFERSSKWIPETGENPSIDEKAFKVLPGTRPSFDDSCCSCCMFRRVAARSDSFRFIPSPLVRSSIESSRANFSNARWFPKLWEWSLLLLLDPVIGEDGEINRSLRSKRDIFLQKVRKKLWFCSLLFSFSSIFNTRPIDFFWLFSTNANTIFMFI